MTSERFCPVAEGAISQPDAPAIISSNERISYFQLNQRVLQIQKIFRKNKYSSTTCLAVKSSSTISLIALIWASLREGVVLSVINDRLPAIQLRSVLDLIQPDELIENVVEYCKTNRTISSSKSNNKEFFDSQIFLPRNKPGLIILTSGSSGTPKAVVLSCDNFYYNALGSNAFIPLTKNDRWLLSLPLFHVSGLGILFRAFLAKATVVLAEDVHNFHEIIVDKQITHISVVAKQLASLLEVNPGKSLHRLKAILLGGGPVARSLVTKCLKDKLPLYISYGSTEMASQVATSLAQENNLSAKILPYRKIWVNNQNEIFVKGETLFLGYWDKREIIKPFASDGWFPTGDIGCLEADGSLSVWGRKDNMFKSRGEKIYPEEIERELVGFSGITQATIVPHIQCSGDVVPVAFLLQETKDRDLDKSVIMKYLYSRLEKFKVPTEYYLLPGKEQDLSLKIDRQFIKNLLMEKERLVALD